jgi:hypothetical protein
MAAFYLNELHDSEYFNHKEHKEHKEEHKGILCVFSLCNSVLSVVKNSP